MAMASSGYQQYKQNSIMTASPEELTLMLYDGCLKFMKQAKMQIEAKNTEAAHIAINKAQNILEELNLTLKMDYEVSKGLRPLYIFMLEQLYLADVKKDTKYIDDVYSLVEDLRDTWKEAMRRAKIERKTGKKFSEVESSVVDEIFK